MYCLHEVNIKLSSLGLQLLMFTSYEGINCIMLVLLGVQWAKMRSDCSFVDIGGIVDHHCLNFLFVMAYYSVVISIPSYHNWL